MLTTEELTALNERIVEEAIRDLDLQATERKKLEAIRDVCETRIEANEALKKRLARDRDYQIRCQAIDARSLPLKEIMKIVREGDKA